MPSECGLGEREEEKVSWGLRQRLRGLGDDHAYVGYCLCVHIVVGGMPRREGERVPEYGETSVPWTDQPGKSDAWDVG